jgi:uncharacterized protein YabE (DUF348 family)
MRKKFTRAKKRYIASHRKRLHHIKRIGKKPLFTVPIATFMVLLLVVVGGLFLTSGGHPQLRPNDPNVVVISYDKQERIVPTYAKTVGDLLNRLDIKLNEGDVVEPAADTEILGDNFRINVYRAVPVTIVDGEQKTFTYSAAATPRSIVKQAGITVYPEDRLALLPTENFLNESSIGERVVIQRATPVMVNLYGTPVLMRTHAKTVGGLLADKHIRLGKDDSVQPAQDAPLTASTQVFLIRKGTQIQTVEEPIAMPIEYVDDESLSFGTTAVRQQGAPGKRLVTYQIQLQNGQEIGRVKIQEATGQDPVKQIVARGTHFDIAKSKTAVMAAAGIPASSYAQADYVIEHESHWNPGALNARGCAGLGQACPGSKLISVCPNWKTDPVCQMRFFNKYAVDRYGGWPGAYQHKVSYGWW